MQKRRTWSYIKVVLLALLVASGNVTTSWAQTSSESNNYQATEMQFGSGSMLDSCSGSYCARASIGEIGGESKNEKNTAVFGPVTPDEPLLEVMVDHGSSDLGTLSTGRTATKTMKVKIRTYLSEGYMLQIVGNPPQYEGHKLKTSSTPTASQPGTEQFGINAVANTTPAIGANPLQVPSSDTSFGQVTDDYKTPNLFKYRSGDVVGRSTTSSGQTDYTISMIVNIANMTPAGHYSGDFSAVVIPVF